jgi:hypothetical protein
VGYIVIEATVNFGKSPGYDDRSRLDHSVHLSKGRYGFVQVCLDVNDGEQTGVSAADRPDSWLLH